MRWDELFADLEGQLEDGLGSEVRELEIEEERLRIGRASLRDRIGAFAAGARPVTVRLRGGGIVAVRVRTTGRDWFSGDLAGTAAQIVVPVAAVTALLPSAEQLRLPPAPVREGALTERIGLPFVLRDLARRRRRVTVTTPDGPTTGTIDRVGRDHLDLAVHAIDDWRRGSAIARIEVVALDGVQFVRVD